jgi:DtxR family Mn-dependent transcriptional regulator
MILTESAQELLEKLWVATVEESTPVVTVEETPLEGVEQLLQLDLVEWNGRGLELTEMGRPQATEAVRRHRLAERLLVDVLATEEAVVDEHACRFEHVLVDGVTESICTLLGHPRFCPHGRPIPPGNCCKRMEASVERLIAPLCDLEAGQQGQIAYIRMNNPKRLQKLMAMGVLPGTPIALLRRFPSFVFEAGYSQFAVDREIAADIYVRLDHEATQCQDRHASVTRRP